jgi:putative copper export protein
VTVGLAKSVPAGFYEVTWQTISRSDGHFTFGSFQFTVLNPDGSDPAGPRPTSTFNLTGRPTSVAEGATTKAAGLVGVALLVGALAATMFVLYPSALDETGPRREKLFRLARHLAISISAVAIVLLALTGGLEMWLQSRQFGGDLSQVLNAEWGQRWLWQQFTLGAIATLLAMHFVANISYRGRYVSLGAAFLAALNYLFFVSLVSHADAVGQGSFWATAADFVHLASSSVWVGGLIALCLIFVWSRSALDDDVRPGFLAGAIRRFSLLAGVSLGLLLITGLFNALVEVSAWNDLVDSAYGRALVLKLILIVPLLAAAVVNTLVLRPRTIREQSSTPASDRLRRLLSRGVAAEAALGVMVLAAVGILTQYTPSRVQADAARAAEAQPASGSQARDAFAYPLTTGNWAWIVVAGLVLAAVFLLIWSARTHRPRPGFLRVTRGASIAMLLIAVGVAGFNMTTSPSSSSAFNASIALRYQATDARFVELAIDPFQVGQNELRITTTTEEGTPTRAGSASLQLYRLDKDAAGDQVATRQSTDGSFLGTYAFTQTGWWGFQVTLDGGARGSFYLRLDNPSHAPLDFNPPDYVSDPAAERVFRSALSQYRSLTALKWREELSSGLLSPTGSSVWVVTDGAGEAPGSISWHVVSPGHSDYQTYWVSDKSCTQDTGTTAWKCQSGQTISPFELDYMEPSTAFQFGRKEVVDGEMTQGVLFYNPSQLAWYAWWIGIDTGQLRGQAMVAPGHFMLTHYYDQNVPIGIAIPADAALPTGASR